MLKSKKVLERYRSNLDKIKLKYPSCYKHLQYFEDAYSIFDNLVQTDWKGVFEQQPWDIYNTRYKHSSLVGTEGELYVAFWYLLNGYNISNAVNKSDQIAGTDLFVSKPTWNRQIRISVKTRSISESGVSIWESDITHKIDRLVLIDIHRMVLLEVPPLTVGKMMGLHNPCTIALDQLLLKHHTTITTITI